ncbi:MAG: bifunctional aspartate kinase/homoserine dehydrogenase I [Saprospirales bacterium]|nr:bifunctional aspartate kinase/homoserine dehydrogenase I [Saprospirales bacterium]
MRVLKFGGSSVSTPERIQGIIKILKSYYSKGEKFTVVFSAFGGATDALLQMGRMASDRNSDYKNLLEEFRTRHEDAVRELVTGTPLKVALQKLKEKHDLLEDVLNGVYLVKEASPRTLDYIVSFGERSSNFIIATALNQEGIPARYLDARQIIQTDDKFGAANVDLAVSFEKIQKHYRQNPEVQVVTGFIGATPEGVTTTLGRGGSDFTAAIIAAALDAEEIEIWTDVDGVLTADPRKVPKAFSIPVMTYAEAMEMSHFGAKVIYPPTLQPALKKGIPLRIKNTFKPDFPGTYISKEKSKHERAVTGISSIGDVALLTLQGGGMFGVPGIAARLFSSLAEAGISVILITQGSSEHSITFAVSPDVAQKAKKQVEEAFAYELEKGRVDPIKIENELSVVAIIGENMRYRPGIAGRLFQALGKNGVNVVAIAQGSSELNISVVVSSADEAKAMNALHEAFFLSDTKELHLFMVGVGLIGKTLIRQIQEQAAFLKEQRSLEVKVVGLANSKKMLFAAEGINLANWEAQLEKKGDPMNLAEYVGIMKDMNLSNSIFVDNTANENVTRFYESILEGSISISTPNKIATSSSFLQYQRLKNIAARRGVQFVYETNVGAGLPVISTLNDLLVSGDRILKIEGVLSGSMSFIFNNFDGTRPFSEIVAEAREKGYTEPDPREDLSGADVRRKILILARETGLPIDSEDVIIEDILPKEAMEAPDVDSFFEELRKLDSHFEKLYQQAAEEGKVLRMIATLENGNASIALKGIGKDHPFYGLSGSDNMIVFTTERYNERPLVVRGPGAGAEVTAAGVFAEIIKIGNYLT